MKLRKLKQEDALLMLEWMHDKLITKYLQEDFLSKNIEDCKKFICAAQDFRLNVHLAVVDSNDIYMGTVSLKHISNGIAEFAIVMRSKAIGKGFSEYAMSKIISIGFEKYGLDAIYWYVLPENHRACHFYDKQGYKRLDNTKSMLKLFPIKVNECNANQASQYYWYFVQKFNKK